MSFQQKSPLELDVIDIDLKEDYSLGTDIECHQNDNLILNFCLRDYGELVDLTNWNVELRVRRADGNDYIQTEAGITKGTDGSLRIITEDGLTCIGGNAKGELRLWNKQYNQKTGRVIYIRVIPSTLAPDNQVSESTITILNHLDLSLDMANDVMSELKEAIEDGEEEIRKLDAKIEEAEETKNRLDESNRIANETNDTLNDTIDVANDRISTLDAQNVRGEANIAELKTQNDRGEANIAELKVENTRGEQNIVDLKAQNTRAETNISDLDQRNTTAVTNKDALDESIANGETIKTALDLSIDTANAVKPPLDEANELAKKNIEQIKNLDTTNIIQDVADIKKEVGDARGTFSTLDERITKAENSGGFFIGEVLPEIAERKPKILYMQILD